MRTNYHKYFHPKECLISNGVLNRAISESAGKSFGMISTDEGNNSQVNNNLAKKNQVYSINIFLNKALSFLYPYGASLNVAKPAVPVLSSGSISFPLNRPVCAFYTHRGLKRLFDICNIDSFNLVGFFKSRYCWKVGCGWIRSHV